MLFFAINIHGKAIQGNKQTNSLPSPPPQNKQPKKTQQTKPKPTPNCFLILVNWESKS